MNPNQRARTLIALSALLASMGASVAQASESNGMADGASAPMQAARLERVSFAADAFFDFDAAALKPEGRAKLDSLIDKVRGLNLEVIVAVGHTESRGSDAYNQKLSVRRAETVKAYLTGKGLDARRVYAEGRGESRPVADNRTEAGRAQNRRVEIEIVGTRKL